MQAAGNGIPLWWTEVEDDMLLLNMEQTLGGRLLAGRTMQSEWGMGGKWLRKCGLELSFMWRSKPADVHFISPVEAQAQGRSTNGAAYK